MCSDEEIELAGGNENTVVRIGDTVRRPLHPWAEAVHTLLRHLESVNFSESPRILGIDEQGREMLTYLPGDVGNYPLTPEMASDSALLAAARLLRRYHDVVVMRPAWESLPWRYRDSNPGKWEVICHSDFAPYNLVFQRANPVGIIDFDVAGPGPRLWDIAYAAYRYVPLASDANCVAFGFGADVDRLGRLGAFLDAYGLDDLTGLLEMVVIRVEELRDDILRRAAVGDPSVATHLREDHVGSYNSDLTWIRDNWQQLDQGDINRSW